MVAKTGGVDPLLLRVSAEQLSHRGPDGCGIFSDHRVGLAHTRLSIIDLAGGRQPLSTDDPPLSLVANGEIYNFPELRRELEAAGRRFSTHSDCESILQAYALEPEGFIDKLHGMFAFALYDRSRQRVLIARDRLGIKPLYYAVLPDRVVFASEIKALLPLLGQTPEINPGAFAQFLQSQFSTGEETIVKQIRRVLPGQILTIDAELNISRRRYWSPLNLTTRAIGYGEAAEEFDALFRQVMEEHLRSDVPYGLFLSGGLDSATLLGMIHEIVDRPIRTYSVGYRDVDLPDELPDAERIAAHFGSFHTPLLLDGKDVMGQLVRSIWAADDLMLDYAGLPTAALAERAQLGLKVVLTGEGGDEVFAGYGRYRAHPLTRFLKRLSSSGSGGFRTRADFDRNWSKRLWGPALARASGGFRAPVIAAWQEAPTHWSFLQHAQYTDMNTALPDNLLVKIDRMLMSFGMEGRVPFLDHRIVEFGLSLPDSLKVKGREGKHFLRRWAERFLPRDHIYRKKRGFGVPLQKWITGDFLNHLQGKLQGNPALNAWFQLEALPALFGQYRSTGRGLGEIFALMQFAIWHRLLIEQPGTRPSSSENPLDWIS